MQHRLLGQGRRQYPGCQFLEHLVIWTMGLRRVHATTFLEHNLSGRTVFGHPHDAAPRTATFVCLGIAITAPNSGAEPC
jgi:hypothetical protein